MRKMFLKKRSAVPKEERIEKSSIITEKLMELDLYKSAQWIFCYIDMASEVITTEFIKKAWADGKKVAVPIAKKDRFMYFVEITSFDGMTRSKLGVMEPDIEPEKQVIPDDNTLMVVPGSMFDIHKNRCGYGGGYYDTYTEKHSVKNTVGICFDLQIADSIPVEKFDRPLKMIISESRTIE